MKTIRKTAALFLLFAVLSLSACGNVSVNWSIGKQISAASGSYEVSSGEANVLALHYKCAFELYYTELLGEDFWQMKLSDGTVFEDYVKEDFIFRECSALLYLQEAAAENGISLTDEEKIVAETAAKNFYGTLTESEKAYIGNRVGPVISLMKKFYLADKTIQALVVSSDTEVSMEESRVLDMSVLHVKEEALAKEILDRLQKGENFETLAAEYSVNSTVSFSVSRQELKSEFSDVVFSLPEGEISSIITSEGEYYILKVSDKYNTLLSVKNRRNMEALRKFDAWSEAISKYQDQTRIRKNSSYWKELKLETEDHFDYVNFFQNFQ